MEEKKDLETKLAPPTDTKVEPEAKPESNPQLPVVEPDDEEVSENSVIRKYGVII